jgi:hypothetical protein
MDERTWEELVEDTDGENGCAELAEALQAAREAAGGED